ncbi:hypothetical protein EUTSA_v10026829mg, partial [Eutrema salsugineum]
MAEGLLVIFILASHLFVSGVLSGSILTIENKCDQTIWPVIFSWQSNLSTSGFALRAGEARALQAPSSWYDLILARTLCSTDTTGNFSCATGDCQSGNVKCLWSYGWSAVTYVYFRIGDGGVNSYTISVEYGYNLPLTVIPSHSSEQCRVKHSSGSETCFAAGCMVDLNKTCPNDLDLFTGGKQIGCISSCLKYGTREICCSHDFKSKQKCKPTMYTRNFERDCPLAYSYLFNDNNSTLTCPDSTDFVVTFCPSSVPNITSEEHNKNSMAPLAGPKHNSLRKFKPILGSAALAVFIIIIVVIVVMVKAKNARKK